MVEVKVRATRTLIGMHSYTNNANFNDVTSKKEVSKVKVKVKPGMGKVNLLPQPIKYR